MGRGEGWRGSGEPPQDNGAGERCRSREVGKRKDVQRTQVWESSVCQKCKYGSDGQVRVGGRGKSDVELVGYQR